MPILAFTGNRFLADETMYKTLLDMGMHARDMPHIGGEDVNEKTILPHLEVGLFGGGGIIVDLDGVKIDKATLELLAGASVTVVILDESPTATRVKVYEKNGKIVASPAPVKTGDIVAWLLQRTRNSKLKIDREAVQYLAEVFGSDLAGIVSELGKLEILGGSFNKDAVYKIVGKDPTGDTFAMLDAVSAGKTSDAVLQLRRLLASGEDPFKLMGAIVWQYSLITRCVALMQEAGNVNENVAAQRLGVKPFPAKKALAVARKLKEESIKNQLMRIMEAELAMKSGLGAEVAIERLLIQLSTAKNS